MYTWFTFLYSKILWKIFKEMGIPDHLTCLLQNLCADQETSVRSRHGTIEWFQIGKGLCQGCILSPCLFNLDAEYIVRNARLDEAQDGIKIAERNISNIRYADNTALMTGSEEEQEIKLPSFPGPCKKQGNSRKISASLTMLKLFTVNDKKLWKIL